MSTDRAAVNLLTALSVLTRLALPALVGGGMAAYASGGSAPELPACTDEGYLATIGEQYTFAEAVRGIKRTISQVQEIEEIGFGVPPASADQYATDENVIAASRYCQATVVLDNGETDTLLWRLDDMRDGDDRSVHYDHCSARHDPFGDDCADYRPAAE
jgi:hypothetical protein